jgi:hypothetical protein
MAAPRRSPPRSEPAAGDRRWLLIAAVVGMIGIAALVWALWPRENKLADLTALQQELLAGDGKPDSADIRRVIATADRMSRDELRAAYRAAFDQWQGIREQAIDESLAARGAERQRLLDAYLDRMLAFGELLQAMNPNASPDRGGFFPGRRRGQPGGQGQPRPEGSVSDSAEAKAEQARREMAARFDGLVAVRAKERGIELPRQRR